VNSHDGQAAVKCNLKANEGQLYFLEKALLFISKQPTLVMFSEISAVVLARYAFSSSSSVVIHPKLKLITIRGHSVGGALPSARTFDLNIRLKDSLSGNPIFSALNKEELTSITEFLSMKKIKVKNEMEELAAAEAEALGGALMDDSDDDDAMSVDSDEEDKPKKRASAKDAKGVNKAAAAQMGPDEDEDSEGTSPSPFCTIHEIAPTDS